MEAAAAEANVSPTDMISLDLKRFQARGLTAHEFADMAFSALESLNSLDTFVRRNGDPKRLIEEILPLALYGRTIDGPHRRASVRYRGDSDDDCDGTIALSGWLVDTGFWVDHLDVEITSAEPPHAYLEREALERYGSVWIGPHIRRTAPRHVAGSSIESLPAVSQPDAWISETARLIERAVAAKIAKRYASKRVLLVRIEPPTLVTENDWHRLASDVSLPPLPAQIQSVVVVENTSLLVGHLL